MIRAWALLTAMLLALPSSPATSRERPVRDVVVLAIGSERYASPTTAPQTAFDDLPDIAVGARDVAELFRRGGARRVRVLVSTASALVSRNDMLAAVDATVTDARAQRKPLIVVYLAAHGVSEGLGWSQFSIPGPMTYEGELATLARREAIELHAVAAGDLVDRLKKSGSPYLLILDNCREGREPGDAGVRETLGTQGVMLIDAVRQGTRMANQFRGPNPVLFSTEPGKSVPTAEHPDHPLTSIGPMARRILLWSRRHPAPGALSLTTLVADLSDPVLDPDTIPASTHAERAKWWAEPLLRAGVAGPAALELRASGGAPDACCSTAAPPVTATILRGGMWIAFAPRGAWLVEDEPGTLNTPAAVLTATVPATGTVTIEASQGARNWSLTLVAPDGRTLAPGNYPGAERAPFQSGGRPGVSFSTTGRSCNEVSGAYAVRKLEVTGGTLRALTADVEIHCDASAEPVRLRVDVVADGASPG